MERCSICNKIADLHKTSKALCAQHYVDVTKPDDLYWDLHALLQEDMVGNSKDSPRRLLEAIKKKYPYLVQRYYLNKQTKKPLAVKDREPQPLAAEYALALSHEKAKAEATTSSPSKDEMKE